MQWLAELFGAGTFGALLPVIVAISVGSGHNMSWRSGYQRLLPAPNRRQG
jgi:hypothetical protein